MASRLRATNGQGWRALLARRIAVRDGPEMITLAGALAMILQMAPDKQQRSELQNAAMKLMAAVGHADVIEAAIRRGITALAGPEEVAKVKNLRSPRFRLMKPKTCKQWRCSQLPLIRR
jgi:hypothetical protein